MGGSDVEVADCIREIQCYHFDKGLGMVTFEKFSLELGPRRDTAEGTCPVCRKTYWRKLKSGPLLDILNWEPPRLR
jgi:hypothetical protein